MSFVWISYIETLAAIYVSLRFINIIYDYYKNKKSIIKISEAAPQKREFVKKHLITFNRMAILFMIAFILVTIMTSYNHIMDWPNVINKNPQTMFAIANSSDIHNDTVEERSVEFIDINTKKKINLTFYSEPITKGECMTLDYYPHIKIAVRMQKYYCYCKKIKLK